MSKYFEVTPKSINVREDGPAESDPIVAKITPEEFLRVFRPNQTEAATPEPGGLDVEAELRRFRVIYEKALGTPINLDRRFNSALAEFIRDLESRRKRAEAEAIARAKEVADV